MEDKLGQQITVGDIVAFALAGGYAGVNIGKVTKFTPKQIRVMNYDKGNVGRHVDGKDVCVYPYDVVVITKLDRIEKLKERE